MAEYIERAAVAKMLEDAQLISDGEYCGYCTEDVSLNSIPAADVVEVRHGIWIGIEYDGYADGCPVYDLWECSECGEEFYYGEPSKHTWAVESAVAPTEAAEGSVTLKCSVCGGTHTEKLPKRGDKAWERTIVSSSCENGVSRKVFTISSARLTPVIPPPSASMLASL